MKISNINYINFTKKFLSKTTVRTTDNTTREIDFVQYEPHDKNDQKKIRQTKNQWTDKDRYINQITEDFEGIAIYFGGKQFWGLEDESGDILAIAETQNSRRAIFIGIGMLLKRENILDISFIQTNPDEIFSAQNKHYKNLGETLVSNIVKKAKSMRKHYVELRSTNEDFWSKSGFFQHTGTECGMPVRSLARKDFNKYIKYVENKTLK